MLSISQLEYIDALDKSRHFGQAAKLTHVTQPTLSMQLLKAEEDLGFPIFDRSKQPIIPTPLGELVVRQARRILQEHAQLKSIAATNEQELQGELRLAIIPTVAPYLLPLIAGTYSRKYPRVNLIVDEYKTEDILWKLDREEIDAGILATPVEHRGLTIQTIYYEPFYLYLNQHHPLLKKKSVRDSDIDPQELWLLQDGHCLKQQTLSFCSKSSKTGKGAQLTNLRFEGGNLETLRYLIRAVGGYTLIPHLFKTSLPAKEQNEQVRTFVNPVPVREISLISRRHTLHQRVTDALIKELRAQLPNELTDKQRHTLVLPAN